MRQKIFLFFKGYWKKLILIVLLAAACALFDKLEFPRIEVFIRDTLQYLNSTENIDKSLVNLNMDLYSGKFKRPYKLDSFKIIIDKLQQSKPKYIFLMMEPLDLSENPRDKKDIYNFFLSQNNLYLNAFVSRNDISSFYQDTLFQSYPRFLKFIITSDQLTGAQDKKNRRAMIHLNNQGPDQLIANLKTLGLKPKDIAHYKYNWKYWETTQAYIKNFKLGSFGNIQSTELLENKINPSNIKNKIILLGTHDEFSYLALPSVFDLFGKAEDKNIRENLMPFQEMVAHLINFYTTGDYIKFLSTINDLYLLFFVLTCLIIANMNSNKKLYSFLLLIPAIILIEVIIYAAGSFYIDFSRSIALLVFIQYLALPILMLIMFKAQEQKKLLEVNNARIDSLLLVSEKIAHDIRSPLSAINLILSRVKFDNPEYKEIINSSLKRIDDTADKILTKYKTTADSKSEIFEPVNIAELINTLIAEKKIIDPKIKYTFEHLKNKKLHVLGYKLELERILSNVLDNSIFALKNKDASPEIIFKLIPKNGFLAIQITDNGIGIPSGVLTLLGKGRVTTKSNEKGNGIGLLHAKRVIERMNGTFEVNSVEAQQTTVTITLKTVNYNDTKV